MCADSVSIASFDKKIKTYAHRGGSGYHVENTMAAFDFAINLGCDGAELDVQLTKDGQVVVYHNTCLNHHYTRVKNGDWLTVDDEKKIASLTLDEIKQYHIGVPNPNSNYHKQFQNLLPVENQEIPTLTEVIQLVKKSSEIFELIIEIKADIHAAEATEAKKLVDAVLTILDTEQFTERAKLCGFDWRALIYAKQKNPKIQTWFTTHPFSWLLDGSDIPKSDISASDSTLIPIRNAWRERTAQWYAGFQPKNLNDFPRMIKQAGGDAWFGFFSDVTHEMIGHSQQCNIGVNSWSVNLCDALLVRQQRGLSVNGEQSPCVDGMGVCEDYPKYLFTDTLPESMQTMMKMANRLRKEKKWSEAKVAFDILFSTYDQTSLPVEVYWQSAIVERMLKNDDMSEKILQNAIELYPRQVNVLIELAALGGKFFEPKNHLQQWEKIDKINSDLINERNYQRYRSSFQSCQAVYVEEDSIGRFFHVALKHKDYKTILYESIRLNHVLEGSELLSLVCYNIKSHYLHTLASECGMVLDCERVWTESLNQSLEQKIITLMLNCLQNDDIQNAQSYFNQWLIVCEVVDDKRINKLLDQIPQFYSGFYLFAIKTCVWLGKYKIAILLRTEIAKRMPNLIGQTRSSALMYEICMSYFYLGDIENMVCKFNELDWKKWKARKSQAINSIMLGMLSLGESEKTIFGKWLPKTENDLKMSFGLEYGMQEMKKLLAGKKVAVIGPASNTERLECIDSYDVVVRINPLNIHSDERTDIAYFTPMVVRNNLEKIECYLSTYKALAVVCNKSVYDLLHVSNKRIRLPSIRPFMAERFSPHGIIRIVWELLRFLPTEIKVFNTSFFMTEYNNSYLASQKNGLLSSYKDARNVGHDHDPLQTLIIAKILNNSTCVSFDDLGKNVLKISTQDYIEFINNQNIVGYSRA